MKSGTFSALKLIRKDHLTMKYVFGFLAIVALGVASIFWFNEGQQQPDPKNLPWQAEMTEEGKVKVFHMTLGDITSRQMMEQFQSFPEIALFEPKGGDAILEAYFGKKRVGLFEAKLVAELQANDETLQRFKANHIERDAQPSGKWKYSLSEPDVKESNSFLVKNLIYIPVADYEQDILLARFGKPAEMLKTKEEAQYWVYPNKGLIILENPDGGEIFYYTTKANFETLKLRLKTEGNQKDD